VSINDIPIVKRAHGLSVREGVGQGELFECTPDSCVCAGVVYLNRANVLKPHA